MASVRPRDPTIPLQRASYCTDPGVCLVYCGHWGAAAFVGLAHKKKVSDPFLMSQSPWIVPALPWPHPHARVVALLSPSLKRGHGTGVQAHFRATSEDCTVALTRCGHTRTTCASPFTAPWHNERNGLRRRSGAKRDIQRHMSARASQMQWAAFSHRYQMNATRSAWRERERDILWE